MNTGKYVNRIKIQQETQIRDSFGQLISDWVDVCTIWAAIEPLRGQEYFNSKQTNSEITTRIRCRYRKGVLPKMRIKFGEEILYIESVINANRSNVELQLMCKELI